MRNAENQVLVPTKIKPTQNPKIKYAKNNLFGRKIGFFMAIIMACLILFNICDIMSSVITNSRSLMKIDKFYVPSYSVYGVSSKDFDSPFDAQNYCDEISTLGALGKVYENGKYYALVQIYPTLLSAGEVRENLTNIGYDAKIITIDIPQIQVNYYGKSKDKAEEGVGIYKRVWLSLYEDEISFDKKNITRENLLGRIAIKIEELQKTKEQISTFGFKECQAKIFAESLTNIIKNLGLVFSFSGSDEGLSSCIKKHMFDIITENIYLSKKFI